MHCINTYKKVDGRRLAVRLPGRHPDCSHFFFGQITQQSTSTMLKMPRAKGKANYKVDIIIQVVESVLPNGMQSWQEVATIYQHRSGELILRDHDDIKRHWIEKCCYKFKKLTGDPGDPKRDMILRCQRIQQKIHEKTSFAIMGVDSEGDGSPALSVDPKELSEEEVDEEDKVAAHEMAVAREAAMAGSRTTTPTNVVDDGDADDGGFAIVNLEVVILPPFQHTQKSAEGSFWPVPCFNQTHQQLSFTLEAPM